MNDQKKNAYRHLLYCALLDIRNYCQPRGAVCSNPLEWRRQYLASRCAGALADWLHNLAICRRKISEGLMKNGSGRNTRHYVVASPTKIASGFVSSTTIAWPNFLPQTSRTKRCTQPFGTPPALASLDCRESRRMAPRLTSAVGKANPHGRFVFRDWRCKDWRRMARLQRDLAVCQTHRRYDRTAVVYSRQTLAFSARCHPRSTPVFRVLIGGLAIEHAVPAYTTFIVFWTVKRGRLEQELKRRGFPVFSS